MSEIDRRLKLALLAREEQDETGEEAMKRFKANKDLEATKQLEVKKKLEADLETSVSKFMRIFAGRAERFHDDEAGPAADTTVQTKRRQDYTVESSDISPRLWREKTPGQSSVERPESLAAYDSVFPVTFSPNGRLLATASVLSGGIAGLWDVASGTEVKKLEGRAVAIVAFSPDGRLIATGSNDWMVRLFDMASGEVVMRLEGHTGSVTAVAFSPDGLQLATASADGTAKLWEVASGVQLMQFEHPTADTVSGVALSPDGRLLATVSSNAIPQLWDVASGALVKQLGNRTQHVRKPSKSENTTQSEHDLTSNDDVNIVHHFGPLFANEPTDDGRHWSLEHLRGRVLEPLTFAAVSSAVLLVLRKKQRMKDAKEATKASSIVGDFSDWDKRFPDDWAAPTLDTTTQSERQEDGVFSRSDQSVWLWPQELSSQSIANDPALSLRQESGGARIGIGSGDSPIIIESNKFDPYDAAKQKRACERCRRREIKCNYQQPCTSCSKANVECIYPSSDKKLLLSSAYLQGLEDKIKELQGIESKVKELEGQSALQKTFHPTQDAGTQTEDLQPDESWSSDIAAETSVFATLVFNKDDQVPTAPSVGQDDGLYSFRDAVALSPENMPADPLAYHMQNSKGQSWNILPSRVLRMLRPRVKPGHQRLEWTCSCGHDMYGDYAAAETDMTESILVCTLPECKVAVNPLYHELDRVQKRRLVLQLLLCVLLLAVAFGIGIYIDLIDANTAVTLFSHASSSNFVTEALLFIFPDWMVSFFLAGNERHSNQPLGFQNVSEIPNAKPVSPDFDTLSGHEATQKSTITATPGVSQNTDTKAGVSSTVGHTKTAPDPVTKSDAVSNVDTQQLPLIPSYFELCVNQGRIRTSLCEIQLRDVHSKRIATDLELFARIRREYDAFKRRGVARFLYRPCDIEFVRFHVLRAGYIAGIMERPLSIPPMDEVNANRYHYYECPMNPPPPIDKRTFFHYFWEHACHPKTTGNPAFDTLFFNRMPKKLGASILEQQATGLQLGWGVHIIEGPNKPLLAWLATGILVLSFAVSLSYDIGYKNKDSGFAIGQWIAAVVGTALTALCFHVADMA